MTFIKDNKKAYNLLINCLLYDFLFSIEPPAGINVLLLSMDNYLSPYWLTFNQAKKLGGTVRAGETSTEILFSDFIVTNKKTKKIIDIKDYNAMIRVLLFYTFTKQYFLHLKWLASLSAQINKLKSIYF
jgi:hypothetical protein